MASNQRLDIVDHVVQDLVERRGVDPSRLMIVGSEARDRLHYDVFGRDDPLRGTSDVDVAIVTDDWKAYESVVAGYVKTGANGVRFHVAGTEVDFMPFGGVEEPDGVVVPAARGEDLSVFGLQDVFGDAALVELPSARHVRFPTAPGYAVLKLRAWVDRGHGEDKDARDLALAVDWYCEDEAIWKASWEPDRIDLLSEYDGNTDLVVARVLGREAASVVAPARAVELGLLLQQRPIDPRSFRYSETRRLERSERIQRIGALQAGVADVAAGIGSATRA